MTIHLNTDLPSILKPYQPSIAATIKPFIRIQTMPDQALKLWQSKFGGLPYLPKEFTYPADAAGNPLRLLAQINCAEIPSGTDFPEEGILQFYIAADDDLYGLNFDDQFEQNQFRVVFFEQVIKDDSQLVTDFGFLAYTDDGLTPITGEYALYFELTEAPISLGDTNFSSAFGRQAYDDTDDADDFYDAYDELFSGAGHKLGGYPFFTQEDPREYRKELRPYVLLFQMDTDNTEGVDIMWGDSGVANFFIMPQDLQNKDFSRVMYNWDCS